MSKIQFWKQITTLSTRDEFRGSLFSICQRYNFESKSQRDGKWHCKDDCCFRYVKDTILKANHNYREWYQSVKDAVFDMSKIQFWKQITTTEHSVILMLSLFSICQRYNFESKSQLALSAPNKPLSCFRYVKDTILKANHNTFCSCVCIG